MKLTRRQILLSSLAAAAAPLQAQQKRPNILFCIADDWGWPHAGAYGAGEWVKTPAFDRIAREGVLFNNAFTSNPKCSPCRATILTGRNSWQLEEATNHFGVFPHKWKVFPEVLEGEGYHVGYTGKGWGPGDYEAGGFDRNPAGPQYSDIKLTPPYRFMSNIDYAANFEDFLSKRPDGAPFSFWLGGQEPHRAYESGSGEKAGKDWRDVEVPAFYPENDETIRRDMTDYAVEVEHFDSHVARAIQKLEAMGELDNTLVIMTSDHGMPFPRVKGQIYEYGFHLPMAARWGGMEGGRKVDDFINVRDLMPTFLDLAGINIPGTVTGKSFLDVLKSNKSGSVDVSRNTMLIGKERHDLGRPNNAGYPVRAIRTEDFLYIRNYEPNAWPAGNPETGYRNVDGSPTKDRILNSFDKWYRLSFGKRPAEELYHVSEDPACVNNLAENPELFQRKVAMREQMLRMLEEEGDPRTLGHPEVFETYRYTGRSTHSWESWEKNQKD